MAILVIGSINYDTHLRVSALPRAGETIVALSATRSTGGKGANQAAAAALNGAHTRFLGWCGTDPASLVALRSLAGAGVDTSPIRRLSNAQTGQATVITDANGENSIIVEPGANALALPSDVTAELDRLLPEDIVLIQAEIPPHIVEHIAEECDERNLRLIVNLAPVTTATRAVEVANPLIVNELEARELGLHLSEGTETDVNAISFRRRHPTIVTLGGNGAVVINSDGHQVHLPGVPVNVVDTTGAGDAFCGALAAELALGKDLVTASSYATAYAAQTVTRLGTIDAYSPREHATS